MGLAELLEAVEAGFDDVEAAGVAEADGVIGTEGDAGDNRDVAADQQFFAEIHAGETSLADP